MVQQHAAQQGRRSMQPQRVSLRSSSQQRGCSCGRRPAAPPALAALLLLVVLQLVCVQRAAAAASQAPCVACEDCVTASCLRMCVPSCQPVAAASEDADAVVLNRQQCKQRGHDVALDIATEACKQAQATCQVGARPMARFQSVGTVSGSQCAALGNGACQKMAASSAYSPCGAQQYFGHRACSGRRFSEVYRGKVGELCLAAMSNSRGG